MKVHVSRDGLAKLPHVGEQLSLELAGPGRSWLEPWGGKSPRGLTKAFERFSLRASPAGGPIRNASRPSDKEQEELVQLLLPFLIKDGVNHG